MRLILVMIFLVAAAVGLHFSEINSLVGFQKEEASAKKLRAVKPKLNRDRDREKVATTESAPRVYTFFETLNDPTMTRHVGLDGKLLPTALPTTAPAMPAEVETARLTLPVEKQAPSGSPSKPKTKIKERHSYAVQVSSFRDAARAGALKMRLQEKGFDAFLTRAEVGDHSGTWHRVFLGRYADEEKARQAARLARSQYKLNAVVIRETVEDY